MHNFVFKSLVSFVNFNDPLFKYHNSKYNCHLQRSNSNFEWMFRRVCIFDTKILDCQYIWILKAYQAKALIPNFYGSQNNEADIKTHEVFQKTVFL